MAEAVLAQRRSRDGKERFGICTLFPKPATHSRCGRRLRTSLDAADVPRLEERATTCRLLRTRRTQIGTRLSARTCKVELVRLIEADFDNLVCRIPAIINVVGQGRWPLAALGPTTTTSGAMVKKLLRWVTAASCLVALDSGHSGTARCSGYWTA